jgi:hypothetical protein
MKYYTDRYNQIKHPQKIDYLYIPDLILRLHNFDICYLSYFPYGEQNGLRYMQEDQQKGQIISE